MYLNHLFFNKQLICTSLFLIYQWLIICSGQTTNYTSIDSVSLINHHNLSLIDHSNNSITSLASHSNLTTLDNHSNLTLSLVKYSNSSTLLSNNLEINSSINNSLVVNNSQIDLKSIVKRTDDLKLAINDNQIEFKNLKTNISKIETLSIQKNESLKVLKSNLVSDLKDNKNQTINTGKKELINEKNVSLNSEFVDLITLNEQLKIHNNSNEKYFQKVKTNEKNLSINKTLINKNESLLKSKVVKKASVELNDKLELIKNETLEKVPIKLMNSSIISMNNSKIDSNKTIEHIINHLTTIKPNILNLNNEINLTTSIDIKQLNYSTITPLAITENPKHLNQTIQSLHLSHSEPLISIPHSDQHWMIPNQLGDRYSNVWPNHEKQIEHQTALSNIHTDGQSNGKIIYGRHFYNATRDHVKLFSCGKFYYRTFHLDAENDVLYVGAMDRIYKLNLSNVNRTHCEADSIYLEPHNTKSCISKGKSEHYECRNHIRVIQRIENGKRLYVCGTNAHSPKDWILNPNLSELNPDEKYPGIGNGIAKCPFDPSDNSTAVWVEQGNPGDLPALYSGTVAEFTRADSVIFRTNLYNFTDGKELYPYRRTVKYDSKWLDKPHFVGSFDIGEYVYFFFRESAVEYINCGKNIFSRVARVCKKDIGGKNILAKNWASFLKARLNCSLPGEFPFYFNEAQHITQHPNDPNTFYGVFSTSNNGLTGSAVCSFTLDSIEKVFLGKFKEQVSSSSQWLPVLTSKVPTPRPGSCHHNTQQLPDSVLNFIRSHPLMDEAVPNQGNINDQYHQTTPESNSQYPFYGNSNSDFYSNGGNVFGSNDNTYANDQQQSSSANNANNNNNFPIFYKKDLIFTKIAVDYLEVDGIKYKLFYIGTSCGKLIKLVQWIRSNGAARSFVLDIIDVFAYNMPGVTTGLPSSSASSTNTVLPDTRNVRAIEISSKHRSIYVATDHFVKQISLLNCKQRYSSCVQCVRDPHCGWDQNAQECKPYTTGLLQDVTNVAPSICDQCAKQYSKQVNVGESIHLPCNIPVHLLNGQQTNSINLGQQPVVSWHFTSANGETTTELKLTGNTLANLHLRQRFVQTSDGGLVVLGATTKEHGYFECRLSNKPLFRYQITVDTKTCDISNEKDFRKVYADWCQQFQKYKQELKRWQSKVMKCDANGLDYQQPPPNLNNNYLSPNN